MFIASDLSLTLGILHIRLLLRYLLEHGREKHIQAGVSLNQVSEFGEDGMQFFGVVFYVTDDAREPFLVDAVVLWKPFPGSLQRQNSNPVTRFLDFTLTEDADAL